MANEKRLIDANALLGRLASSSESWAKSLQAIRNWWPHAVGIKDNIVGVINDMPTVDAVVLPCKIDDDVYIIPSETNFKLNILGNRKENNRVYHQKVANIVFGKDGWYMAGSADKEYGTGRILLDRFYKETWFLTEEEAKAALAKMDGGNRVFKCNLFHPNDGRRYKNPDDFCSYGERRKEKGRNKITKQQYDELVDAYEFDEQEFIEKLEEYTGITRRSYTAYDYYSGCDNYIGNSEDFDLDDILRKAYVEVVEDV